MSHEIRRPMNGVIGLIDGLRASPLDDDQRCVLSLIDESAETLLGLIDDILDFSKIEAGRLELEATDFDLVADVEKVCATLLQLARSAGVAFTVFIDPALPARVQGDPIRLRQILINLVSNAVKFSAGLGRPGRVEAAVSDQARTLVQFTVADNGIGMSESARQRLSVSGEAERCRAAGMDDYIGKPTRLAELRWVLAHWMKPVASAAKLTVDEEKQGKNEKWGNGLAARYVGALALGDACERLEHLSGSNFDAEAARLAQEVDAAIGSVLDSLAEPGSGPVDVFHSVGGAAEVEPDGRGDAKGN